MAMTLVSIIPALTVLRKFNQEIVITAIKREMR